MKMIKPDPKYIDCYVFGGDHWYRIEDVVQAPGWPIYWVLRPLDGHQSPFTPRDTTIRCYRMFPENTFSSFPSEVVHNPYRRIYQRIAV